MGLRFHSDEQPLVIYRGNGKLPCSDQMESMIQSILIQNGYSESFAERISFISGDEEFVIIQIPSVSEQCGCPETFRDEIGTIIKDSYGWDSVIILTTDEI